MSKIDIQTKVLKRNDLVATKNRESFDEFGAYVINLISSPGTGKTSMLEATLERLSTEVNVAVIEGDVQTDNDAARVRATGIAAEAIITGGGCHLDATMVGKAFDALKTRIDETLDLLIVDNVGNLVCPSAYDLGEDEKVALVSVTEGEDKPIKYPALFSVAGVCLVTKVDLLPHLDFDVELLVKNIRAVNPAMDIFLVSAKNGDGMAKWIEYLVEKSKNNVEGDMS
jgi:hydrogenase nickel incorporation protein HypB